MIAWLSGSVLSNDADRVVVNVSGVGYELTCPVSTLSELPVGESTQLFVYTHVREDQISLFGFVTELEKQLFESLLGVNGVGPKLAIKILSAAPVSAIAAAIENSDIAFLSKLPKVGQKTANQLVVSLKGKLSAVIGANLGAKGEGASDASRLLGGASGLGKGRALGAGSQKPALALFQGRPLEDHEQQILMALQNLGFREAELQDHLERVFALAQSELESGSDPVEAGIRWALKSLGGRA